MTLKGQVNNSIDFPIEKKVVLNESLMMSYYDMGHGEETIIFIHGLGSNKKAWLKLMPYLSDTGAFTLYAIDLPKYLDTDDVTLIGMKHYAECIRLFMEKMKIRQSIICGHSMGGQIAMHFGLEHPQRVDKMILLAPAGLEVFDKDNKKWFDTYVTKAFYLNQTDDQIRRNFDINFYGNALPENAEFMYTDRINLMQDSIVYGRYVDYILACIGSMLKEEVYNSLMNIEIPSLVVFGKNDMLIPNRLLHPTLNVEAILNEAKRIPNVDTLLFDQAGHFVQWDQAKMLSENISKFIQEN